MLIADKENVISLSSFLIVVTSLKGVPLSINISDLELV